MSRLAALVLACSLLIAMARGWIPDFAALPVAWLSSGLALGFLALALLFPARLSGVGWAGAACALAVLRGALDAKRERPLDPGPGFAIERPLWLRARICGAPQATRRGTRVLARVLASDPRLPRDLGLTLWCDAAAGVPRMGSRIRAHVLARAPRATSTPGGFDERAWLAGRGASLLARVQGAAWVEERPPPHSLSGYLEATRRRWSRRLADLVPGEAGEFLRGLLLGERSRVSPETVDELRRAGALHLLALSGQHVILVAALLEGLARMLRASGRGGSALALLGVWAYSLLTGSSPSVLRAAAAVTWQAWARALGRRVSGADGLSWGTALPILAAPSLSADAGFQLSCLASAGLWAAARSRRSFELWAEDRSTASLRLLRALEKGASPIVATAFAQAAVLPLLAARFGAVSVIGLASNLVLVPACDVLLALGLPLLAVECAAPTPAPLWRVLSAVAAFLLRAGEWFASWPGAWTPCAMSCAAAVTMTAAAALPWILASRRRESLRGGAWAAAGMWLGLAVTAFAPLAPRRDVDVRYWLLDVGQGDAQVLEFRDGTTWVVDVGDAREGFDAGRSVVAPFLRMRGVRELDRAVITHEDRDHSGGLAGLARDIAIRRVVSSAECVEVLRRRATRLRWGKPLAAGETLLARPGVSARVLWPPPGVTGLAANERSVVLEVDAGGDRLVLTGDADSTSEARWLPAAVAPIAALKLGHHGSRGSTAMGTLDGLRPRLALISCGAGNRFGHPHPETLARLAARAVPWRRTDRQGTLELDLGARSEIEPPRCAWRAPPFD